MRIVTYTLTALLSSSLLLSSCTPKPPPDQTREALVEKESVRLNAWFEDRFNDQLARSPMSRTYLGSKDGQHRLDDASQLGLDEDTALQKAWLTELRTSFDIDRLEPQALLSHRLFQISAEDALESHAFSGHHYVFDHMSGPHSQLPSFLINFHQVASVEDARAYISRLIALETYLTQHIDRADAQAANGILLPDFIYPQMIGAARNVVTGAPFDPGEPSPLWADIAAKIDGLDIEDGEKDTLKSEAKAALLEHVAPAYAELVTMFERHQSKSNSDAGVWKLPRGDEYYASRLKHFTTTDYTADDIHALGLKEVARIKAEMRAIMRDVEFNGTLEDFFKYLRTDPKFTYPDTDDGRERYMREATDVIDAMKARLDELFITQPKADMIVKPVEAFRQDTAGIAFYDQPALDGSRPGTYYINLRNMTELPIYQRDALAYHEGIPGHHMQIAIAMELEGLPKFRTLGGYTSYIEGWGLYAEALPKELGFYSDPYQDFGRLSMEIFRAARLVVDTGLHTKKWTREQAVDYMMENTANSEGDIRIEVDRYIVWPGQATAYKIGMIKIQELRVEAQDRLGDKFDIREFHDVILANGSVPLTVLEELVDEWVKSKF